MPLAATITAAIRPLFQSATVAPRVVLIALLAIVVIGGALRADAAAHPNIGYESADERSYALLSQSLSHGHYDQRGASNDLHWPPGAPAFFAVARTLVPISPKSKRASDVRSAYWAQAALSTITLVLIFVLGALLAGPVAGLVAAALIAVYPPIIAINGSLLSETLGAALATLAALLLVIALRDRSWRKMLLAGGAFGLLVLTRTDFLLAIVVIGLAIALLCRREGIGPAAARAGAFVVAAVLVLVPWVLYASHRSGGFVPVTSGSGSALFVGTYLPGNGTTYGLKREFAPQVRARHRQYASTFVYDIPARHALDLVAARHPHISRDAALKREARRNLVKYGLGRPLAFARMMSWKATRMWLTSYRGGGVAPVSVPVRIVHWTLIATSVIGLLALLITRRLTGEISLILVLLLYTTLVHTVFVSKARYNVPVLPMLVVAGVAGLATVLRRRTRADGAVPAGGR